MTNSRFISPDEMRSSFSRAMSLMYRQEVPAYGTLMEIVAQVNATVLAAEPHLQADLEMTGTLDRISDERHGAIRLGTAAELSMICRAFALMGMFPVGYYDLSVAGIPVHSTAFRPIDEASLRINPFRIFTSLLRLDLIADADLKHEAEEALGRREIFSPDAVRLVTKGETEGGLAGPDAALFIHEMLETFRWHDRATVTHDLYERLHKTHGLLADVVSFRGAHINHLTPRTLDIDKVQEMMPLKGIRAKETIEGPPARNCPILLRQTSFKALEEAISFGTHDGKWTPGTHTARFGEVEQRGVALTPKGRALYDSLLAKASEATRKNGTDRAIAAREAFAEFPDNYQAMRDEGLAYFEYRLAENAPQTARRSGFAGTLEAWIEAGLVSCHPIVYEDFLPVSAAGIFRSNLGADEVQTFTKNPNRGAFETALGVPVTDEFELYSAMERASIERCTRALAPGSTAQARS